MRVCANIVFKLLRRFNFSFAKLSSHMLFVWETHPGQMCKMDACAQNKSKHTCSNTCFDPSEMSGSDTTGDKVSVSVRCVFVLGDGQRRGQLKKLKPSYCKYIKLFSM